MQKQIISPQLSIQRSTFKDTPSACFQFLRVCYMIWSKKKVCEMLQLHDILVVHTFSYRLAKRSQAHPRARAVRIYTENFYWCYASFHSFIQWNEWTTTHTIPSENQSDIKDANASTHCSFDWLRACNVVLVMLWGKCYEVRFIFLSFCACLLLFFACFFSCCCSCCRLFVSLFLALFSAFHLGVTRLAHSFQLATLLLLLRR